MEGQGEMNYKRKLKHIQLLYDTDVQSEKEIYLWKKCLLSFVLTTAEGSRTLRYQRNGNPCATMPWMLRQLPYDTKINGAFPKHRNRYNISSTYVFIAERWLRTNHVTSLMQYYITEQVYRFCRTIVPCFENGTRHHYGFNKVLNWALLFYFWTVLP
jgi:hypothetical protein